MVNFTACQTKSNLNKLILNRKEEGDLSGKSRESAGETRGNRASLYRAEGHCTSFTIQKVT